MKLGKDEEPANQTGSTSTGGLCWGEFGNSVMARPHLWVQGGSVPVGGAGDTQPMAVTVSPGRDKHLQRCQSCCPILHPHSCGFGCSQCPWSHSLATNPEDTSTPEALREAPATKCFVCLVWAIFVGKSSPDSPWELQDIPDPLSFHQPWGKCSRAHSCSSSSGKSQPWVKNYRFKDAWIEVTTSSAMFLGSLPKPSQQRGAAQIFTGGTKERQRRQRGVEKTLQKQNLKKVLCPKWPSGRFRACLAQGEAAVSSGRPWVQWWLLRLVPPLSHPASLTAPHLSLRLFLEVSSLGTNKQTQPRPQAEVGQLRKTRRDDNVGKWNTEKLKHQEFLIDWRSKSCNNFIIISDELIKGG